MGSYKQMRRLPRGELEGRNKLIHMFNSVCSPESTKLTSPCYNFEVPSMVSYVRKWSKFQPWNSRLVMPRMVNKSISISYENYPHIEAT
jgi:hypothetical protein